MRLGIIGTGAIADTYSQVLRQEPIATVVGVADVDEDRAQRFAETLGCPSFQSIEELFEKGKPQAVIIATPPATHHSIAKFFLEREVHVLCEKPLTIDLASALDLIAIARRTHTVLTMASKFRFVEDIAKARTMVQSGILGEILFIKNGFFSDVDMSGRWNSRRDLSGGGVLIDNGTHSVDIVRYLLGPVKQIKVIEGTRARGLPVEENVEMLLRTESGTMARVDLSWSTKLGAEDYLVIQGTEGRAVIGWRESRVRAYPLGEWSKFGTGYNKFTAFRKKLDNFFASIRGEEEPLVNEEDMLASVRVIDAGYRSLQTGNWVEVDTLSRSIPAAGQTALTPIDWQRYYVAE